MVRFLFFLSMFLPGAMFGQIKFDSLNWRSPVDIPIYLSGNFAELRSSHFHAGIDIKTNGKEGARLYAVQDGYISRIKITPGGYGNALYITHPDGYTSVYAHMKEFNIQIERYTRTRQYANESFMVDLFPMANELPVRKGDIIGLSGNSGSSMGPHLHFEIRNNYNSNPLNGLFIGLDIKDTIPPVLYELHVFPTSKQSEVNGKKQKSVVNIVPKRGRYGLSTTDTIFYSGEIGLGLKANDFLNGSANRCGLYHILVKVNNSPYFETQFDEVPFSEARYIQTYVDFEESEKDGTRLHKLYIEPNNRLSVYKKSVNKGKLVSDSIKVKNIEILCYDAVGNKSVLKFVAKQVPLKLPNDTAKASLLSIKWDEKFSFDSLGLTFTMLPKSLYNDLDLMYSVDTVLKSGMLSAVYNIHNATVPIHLYYDIAFNVSNIPDSLASKVTLVKLINGKMIPKGGQLINGKFTARLSEFGSFALVYDTVPPIVVPLKALRDRTNISGVDTLMLKIDDELSGIVKYQGKINGQWVLFQWDPKNSLLFYKTDEYMPTQGEINLKVKVDDERGNSTLFERNYVVNPL